MDSGEAVTRELKRNGTFDSKKEELYEAFLRSGLKDKIEEASSRAIDALLQSHGHDNSSDLQKRVLHSVLNDETVKALFVDLKNEMLDSDSVHRWAGEVVENAVKCIEKEASAANGAGLIHSADAPSPAAPTIILESQVVASQKKKFAEEIQSVVSSLQASSKLSESVLSKNVLEKREAVPAASVTPSKKLKTDGVEVPMSESSPHPLIGVNVAALTRSQEYIIARVMKFYGKENRFLVKDSVAKGDKLFEPQAIVDYLHCNYGKDKLHVGQKIMALYPLEDSEFTTMFYAATVIDLRDDGLTVEYEEGNEQHALGYGCVFSPSDALELKKSVPATAAENGANGHAPVPAAEPKAPSDLLDHQPLVSGDSLANSTCNLQPEAVAPPAAAAESVPTEPSQ